MNINAAQQFTATVTNSTNTAVTWTVQESAAGTITTAGNYTAPAVPGTYHVVATSQADATKSATAAVTVQATTPTISSVPVTTGTEGVAYTYDPAATDPGGTAITFTMTTSPTGATFDGQHVAWTPTNEQSRMANDFSIKATTAAGGVKTQSWTVTPTGSVLYTRQSHYITDAGVVDRNTTESYATLIQQQGATFATLSGSAEPDGSIKFPNVPAGSYWILHDQTYDQGTRNSVVVNAYEYGRPDLTFGYPNVTYTLSGLNDITLGDSLQVISVGAAVSDTQALSLPIGSTSGTFTSAWNNLLGGLPVAAEGDMTTICQRQRVTVGSRTVNRVAVCSPPEALTVPTGASAISATLASVPQITYRLHVSGDTYEALVPSLGSSVATQTSNFVVQMQPSNTDFYRAPVVSSVVETSPVTTNQDDGDVTFGNPLSGWAPQFVYRHWVGRNYTAPGAVNPRMQSVAFQTWTSDAPTAASPILATLGPVTAPKINGLDLTVDHTGVGVTPVLSWSAPTKGTPDVYFIEIASVVPVGANTFISAKAWFNTTSTTFTVPSGILQSGTAYVISIYADQGYVGGVSTKSATAPMLSGLITP